jgi:hypothetical protein
MGPTQNNVVLARGFIMDERRAFLLRVHERNIDRYQRLLKTKLSHAEVHYLEKRLSEERFAVAMLQFMSPTDQDFGGALE